MWGRNQINIREPVQSAFVPNAFWVASARRDERESRESRPGDETSDIWQTNDMRTRELLPRTESKNSFSVGIGNYNHINFNVIVITWHHCWCLIDSVFQSRQCIIINIPSKRYLTDWKFVNFCFQIPNLWSICVNCNIFWKYERSVFASY